ncbi:MAG: hypothetical protein RBG13Loki_0857 [Promethearchaeota archaeon CR_4]|nr:MAG: hypothetical protein RBG13Loki_0857 [Candidatus Lokiarchaeota archaeon CR_4]
MVGIPESNITLFSQELIDQLVSNGGISPDILDVKFHKILYNDKWYIIISVPMSQSAPHLLNGKIPCRFDKITKYFETREEWEANIIRDSPKGNINGTDEQWF